MSGDELRSRGPGDVPATTHPALSINIRRELATVVVTLEGVLDEDSSPALIALLWDLVVGQGNLSVAVDARGLTPSDPVLIWSFQALAQEAELRGGKLAVVERSPPSTSPGPNLTAVALDHRRARRIAALGRAAHPAGGRSDHTNRIGGEPTHDRM